MGIYNTAAGSRHACGFRYDYAGRCYQRDQLVVDAGGVYTTDANKNVSAYYTWDEWASAIVGIPYTYSPFGEPHNGARRFAFSSEEWLGDYGLLRYLYRDYSPSLKRFLTRDPIGEAGGINLYNFVGNNPMTGWDNWGLRDPKTHGTRRCDYHDDCETLIAKTAAWMEHYNLRHEQLIADKLNLRTTDPLGYNNHITELGKAKANVENCIFLLGVAIDCGLCPGGTKEPVFSPYTAPDYVPIPDSHNYDSWNWRKIGLYGTAGLIVAGTLLEDVLTLGWGAVDDPISFSTAGLLVGVGGAL